MNLKKVFILFVKHLKRYFYESEQNKNKYILSGFNIFG
jgi:hypothetical protein